MRLNHRGVISRLYVYRHDTWNTLSGRVKRVTSEGAGSAAGQTLGELWQERLRHPMPITGDMGSLKAIRTQRHRVEYPLIYSTQTIIAYLKFD